MREIGWDPCMENKEHFSVCPNCGHTWEHKRTKSMFPKRRPRGKRLPFELESAAKIRESRNTLNAIAKAYNLSKGHLSEVLNGKRNTKRLIEILEFEFKMPIEKIRSFLDKHREGEKANLTTYFNTKEGVTHE